MPAQSSASASASQRAAAPAIEAVAPPRRPETPLAASTWLARHGFISVALAAFITIVVGWSAAIGHTGAELLGYVAPLLAAGALATRAMFSERIREFALAFGLFTAAALVANFAENSILAPVGYFLALCLASLYERRETLAFAILLTLAHELLFHTVIPNGPPVSGLSDAASRGLFGLSFLLAAGVLTVPWRSNAADRRLLRHQRALIEDQLAVSEIVIAVGLEGQVTLISDHGLMVLGRDRTEVIGADFFDLVVRPEQMEAARAGHARFLAAGPQLAAPAFYEFEHAILVGSGERRTFLWRVTVSMDGDEVTGTVASGFDITEVRRAQHQLQREQRDLVQLQQLAQAVARESDARDAVVDGVARLVDASVAGLFEPSPGGDELILVRCSNPDLMGARIPFVGTPSGVAMAYSSGEPFFVADAVDHPLINQELRRRTGSTSFLYHPVILDGHAAGVLAVGWEGRVAELGSRQTNLVALAAEEAASALQRVAAMRRWEEAALTDVLTGIPNRRAFDRLFEDALAHAAAEEQPLAVALMDLNGFKKLNDSEGHAAGDRVLKESASLWLEELRPTDVLARLGGDEFAVLLPNCRASDTDAVAARLRRALRHEAGCGVGIAVWDRSEAASALLHRADETLYADKAAGARERLADAGRLEAVEATHLLDEPADPQLDALTEMVTALVGVPRSTITLVTEDRQFFASQCSIGSFLADADPVTETPLSHSYCQHPATTGRELIVSDAREHPLLRENLSTTEAGLVAYAGIPLVAGGETFGVLCAIDTERREWSEDDLGTLRSVARRATALIAARAAKH